MKTASVALVLLAGLSTVPASSEDPKLEDMKWLAGHWSSEVNGRLTEELWMAPGGGLMLGVNRTIPSSGRTAFEYLRIEETEDGITYVASPGGGSTTRFPLADFGEDFVEFENLAHDFPQHIRYELGGTGELNVKVWAGENGLAWTWKRR